MEIFDVQIRNTKTGAWFIWEEMTEEMLAAWMADLNGDFEIVEKFNYRIV